MGMFVTVKLKGKFFWNCMINPSIAFISIKMQVEYIHLLHQKDSDTYKVSLQTVKHFY
jgi:hypothetical protein